MHFASLLSIPHWYFPFPSINFRICEKENNFFYAILSLKICVWMTVIELHFDALIEYMIKDIFNSSIENNQIDIPFKRFPWKLLLMYMCFTLLFWDIVHLWITCLYEYVCNSYAMFIHISTHMHRSVSFIIIYVCKY